MLRSRWLAETISYDPLQTEVTVTGDLMKYVNRKIMIWLGGQLPSGEIWLLVCVTL